METEAWWTRDIVNGRPSQAVLDDLVRRIVEAVHPLRIVLFGSAARGEMGTHSDLDVLVVVPDGVNRREIVLAIRRKLRGLSLPKDVVVATENDTRIHAENFSLVLFPALREGKELYRVA